MEIDEDVVMDEPEGEMEDDEAIEEIESRRPVMINDGEFIIDQQLAHARLNMQAPYYARIDKSHSVDPALRAASFMAVYDR